MENALSPLLLTAVSLGLIHTILGPDHYVPFIALSKANGWSFRKTMLISTVCGLGHCLSSVLIGFIGIALGVAVGRLEWVEGLRGDLASYMMIAFGLAYLVWAMKKLIRGQKHAHVHAHGALAHSHEHAHTLEHLHPHSEKGKNKNLYWGLFLVFVFGPCEPLIPLLMYPAAKASVGATALVAAAFTLTTVATMLLAVAVGVRGLAWARFPRLARYSDVLASSAIILCGVLIIAGL